MKSTTSPRSHLGLFKDLAEAVSQTAKSGDLIYIYRTARIGCGACIFCYAEQVKILILENIRSAYNVGAVFRTADGAGVSKIFLVGYTPAPVDRFGRVQTEIKKTSLGASEEISWEQRTDIDSLVNELHKDGVVVAAVEQSPNSVSLAKFKVPEKIAYIVGNEVDGVSESALTLADTIIEIPMLGTKESLNVSVAAGIILYHGLGT